MCVLRLSPPKQLPWNLEAQKVLCRGCMTTILIASPTPMQSRVWLPGSWRNRAEDTATPTREYIFIYHRRRFPPHSRLLSRESFLSAGVLVNCPTQASTQNLSNTPILSNNIEYSANRLSPDSLQTSCGSWVDCDYIMNGKYRRGISCMVRSSE